MLSYQNLFYKNINFLNKTYQRKTVFINNIIFFILMNILFL